MNKLKMTMASLLLVAATGSAQAEHLKAVKPLDGYACMDLNLTEAQLRDNSVTVPILSGPSPDAPWGGNASAIVIVRAPLHVVNGYAEILKLDGQPGWIAADKLKPYASVSNPNAHCTPSVMSNGRPGFG